MASLALAIAGCGGGDAETTSATAPSASDFPSASGRPLSQIVAVAPAGNSVVVSPTGRVFEKGPNRLGFGVFTASRRQITDAQVALYAAPSGGGPATGPFPARVESLTTQPQFRSRTVATDPDAAHVVYVAHIDLNREGNWDLAVVIRQGDELVSTRIPSITVGGFEKIPAVGERPPAIHTPTASDVGGDLSKIDTRVPHDDMHQADLADILRTKPVVLLFATPALCESRTCGPVVDVEEEVSSKFAEQGVAFLHMEIYNHNDPNRGLRPQLRAFGLPTEPWLFVIDRSGRVSTRIEGAFSAQELEAAVRKVVGRE
jgi:hypothetical protein